ncbi:glucose-like phosphotransferase system IIB component [Staphylococcus cohnii]
MSKEQKLAENIVNAVGGLENMENVINCMTRVRIKVHDENKVDYDKLKSTNGVMGVVKDDRVQVVVGPGTVNKVADHISEMSGVRLGETIPHQDKNYKAETESRAKENKAAFQSKQKRGKFNKLLKTIANIFIPLIPAFIGAGLIGGIGAVLSNLLAAEVISLGLRNLSLFLM